MADKPPSASNPCLRNPNSLIWVKYFPVIFRQTSSGQLGQPSSSGHTAPQPSNFKATGIKIPCIFPCYRELFGRDTFANDSVHRHQVTRTEFIKAFMPQGPPTAGLCASGFSHFQKPRPIPPPPYPFSQFAFSALRHSARCETFRGIPTNALPPETTTTCPEARC